MNRENLVNMENLTLMSIEDLMDMVGVPTPDEYSTAFNGMPLKTVNTTGRCATAKLILCYNAGRLEASIHHKFYREPEDFKYIPRDDFLVNKNLIEQIDNWEEKNGIKTIDGWVAIAHMYELVKGSANRAKDWGHLLFTDFTITKFLIVMVFPEACQCGNFSHHDYEAMTKYQADRLLSLATYLHHDKDPPKWVRATYVTPKNNYALDPDFLASTSAPAPAEMRDRLARGALPIFHVSATDFIPSLRESEIEKIDNLRKTNSFTGDEPIAQAVRRRVIGGKDAKLRVRSETFQERNMRICGYCSEMKVKDLMMCSRCKLVYYCGRECQRLAWPAHKSLCNGQVTLHS